MPTLPSAEPWPQTPPPRLTLHGEPLSAELCRPPEAGFRDGSDFVLQRYWRHYGARPRITASFLMLLRDQTGACRAVAGLTPAAGQRLFLERYLDHPVEQLTSREAGSPVPRQNIWEVANLAADGSGAGRMLFVALTAALANLGGEWIAFTATVQVRNMFVRLGLSPVSVAKAEPDRLGDEVRNWGRYYQHDPQVMLGHVPPGQRSLVRQGWLTGPEVRNDVVA
ncbi:MAG: thermostable hemolysin [Alcanivorax sp.]|uniref:Thermostable hemolysin n=1 Tax=Alloalcanivorax venustensis ISO4 TaxID=1177184 RepID=A0ABS0AGD9_9GAMM|nr:thermostable hemolysin [Alloalcanivorax venustensis]MBF5053171.1 hypothetical protein [Alloalcanivorax venustensis ISO4]MBL4714100.1 thermostable hemolysin [Alcanivorax sp.]